MANEEFKKFVDSLEPGEKPITNIGTPIKPIVEKTEETGDEVEETETKKNRRHRRLESKLQAEREANIALTERVRVLSELRGEKTVNQTEDNEEIDPRILRVFGDYEKGKEIAKEFTSILKDSTRQAREEAIQEIEKSQNQGVEMEKEYVSYLKNEFDKIEDEYDIDFDSDDEARTGFVDFIQRISPKDDEGQIKDYPDIQEAWVTYQEVKGKKAPESNARREEIANRSMAKSGTGTAQAKQPTPGFYGWRKDFKL